MNPSVKTLNARAKKVLNSIGIATLICLSLVGWYVLLVQNPNILLRARLRYLQARYEGIGLSTGPCLGKLTNNWVLDIAHLPRDLVDEDPANQCLDYRQNRVFHL